MFKRKPQPECATKEDHQVLLGEVRRLGPLIRSIDRDDWGDDRWEEREAVARGEKAGVALALNALEDVERGIFSLGEIKLQLAGQARPYL